MGNHTTNEKWPGFAEILQGLHRDGIYIHTEQLAEFMLAHGLPVDLRYVPDYLKQKAIKINQNYQGDMAKLSEQVEAAFGDYTCYW